MTAQPPDTIEAALAEQWDEAPSPECKDCGSALVWDDCSSCDEGYTPVGLLHEVEPDWYDEDDVEPCDICEAKGGWWSCPNRQCSVDRLNAKRAAHGLEPAEPAPEARPSVAAGEGEA